RRRFSDFAEMLRAEPGEHRTDDARRADKKCRRCDEQIRRPGEHANRQADDRDDGADTCDAAHGVDRIPARMRSAFVAVAREHWQMRIAWVFRLAIRTSTPEEYRSARGRHASRVHAISAEAHRRHLRQATPRRS